MELTERLQVLVETSTHIIEVYNEHMGNDKIGLGLRQLMADSSVILSRMIEDAENLQLFDAKDPDIIKLKEELFEVFNEYVSKNAEVFNQLYLIKN